MEKQINFLKAKEKISERAIKLRRLVQVGSSLFLVFYIIIAGSLFSFRLIQDRQVQTVGQKANQAKIKINSLKKIESLQVSLKERLRTLTAIFKEPGLDYQEAILYLEDLSPSGISLDEISLNKQGEIDVNGAADNSQVLDEFLNALSESGKEFESIILTSLRNRVEKYEFNIRLLKETS
ncbi:MAG TPA: hypothetical protein VMX77_01175 [Candidatus Bathyarchaeia archaeon]|nr:hypothetical protein [Candidatus Bathyarchaeia archaeon]